MRSSTLCKAYRANSPYAKADRIDAPLLLLQGADDDGTGALESEKMFAALRALGKTAQLATCPGDGHVMFLWSQRHRVDACQRVLDYLAENLTKEHTTSFTANGTTR